MAGDEDAAAPVGHERQRQVYGPHLRVPVQAHGVVGGHVSLQPAGGVEHEDVEAAEALPDSVEHPACLVGVDEVGLLRRLVDQLLLR